MCTRRLASGTHLVQTSSYEDSQPGHYAKEGRQIAKWSTYAPISYNSESKSICLHDIAKSVVLETEILL